MERVAYDKRFGEFFACDKGMHACLLRSPSSNGIQGEETLAEINEGSAIRHFYTSMSLVCVYVCLRREKRNDTFVELVAQSPARRLYLRDGSGVDDIVERCGLEVVFSWLFVSSMFSSVLVHGLHLVLAFILVGMGVPDLVGIKELRDLLA